MSLTTEALRELVQCGLTAEQILRVAEANEKPATEKTLRQERNRRYYESKRLKASEQDVLKASETDPLPLPSSPQTPQLPTPTPGNNTRPRKGRLAKPELDALVDQIWRLQPVTGGKRKATRPDVLAALRPALNRGGEPGDILAALTAYYRLPSCRENDGQFSKGAAVMLNADRWRDFLPSPEPDRPVGPTDPAVLARRMRRFADTGVWEPGWGPKPPADPITATSPATGAAA